MYIIQRFQLSTQLFYSYVLRSYLLIPAVAKESFLKQQTSTSSSAQNSTTDTHTLMLPFQLRPPWTRHCKSIWHGLTGVGRKSRFKGSKRIAYHYGSACSGIRGCSSARTGGFESNVHDLFETCVLICAAFMKAIFFWFFFIMFVWWT